MAAVVIQDRDHMAGEYLRLLQCLAGELDTAMHAIARNALSDFEESLSNQQTLSMKLGELVSAMGPRLEITPSAPPPIIDGDLGHKIQAANDRLQRLNNRYSALLTHSSQSIELMTSLCRSFTGQFQEASGARSKQQTWSCQM